ncbi:MAG: hypothetical protein ACOC93_00210 [Planctomycetota bacterium]
MRRIVFALLMAAVTASPALAAEAVPTDNPVATYYGGPAGYPAWTDEIRWDRVVDMSTYDKGETNFEKFENARDELASEGGGVLYYPAGTYDFSDMPADGPKGRGLMLPSGVVIRGAAPLRSPGARDGVLPLRTKFVFGMREKRQNVELTLVDGMQRQRGGEERPSDVTLRFRLEDGRVFEEITVRDPGFTRQKYVVPAEVSDEGQGWRIRLEVPLKTRSGDEQSLSVGYDVRVGAGGDGTFTGSYESAFEGDAFSAEQATGEVVGASAEPSVIPRDWNLVGLQSPGDGEQGLAEVENVGICWVNLQGGVVYFGPELAWYDTWGEAAEKAPKGWPEGIIPLESLVARYAKPAWRSRVPDGTHPLDPLSGAPWGRDSYVGAGSGRVVFGCVLQDSAVATDTHDMGAGPDSFHTHRFGARIGIAGSEVFVANNLLPQSDKSFLYSQPTMTTGRGKWGQVQETTLMFDYGKQAGIDVNKDILRQTKDRPMGRASAGYFEPGVVVRDNWVYNHGHKGFSVSGTWVTIQDNVNQRDVIREGQDPYGLGGDWRLTMDGYLQSVAGSSRYGGENSDNLSRAFDLAGQNLWIDGNWYDDLGSWPGNDGEGILCQLWAGTRWRSWTATHNVHIRGEGKMGYIAGWAVDTYGSLVAWNDVPGPAGLMAARGSEVYDAAFLAGPRGRAAGLEDPGRGQVYDVIGGSRAEQLTPPQNVTLEQVEDAGVRIAWEDASDNEIGFRIDRRIDGGPWRTIAYRPRHSRGHPLNPQAWVDYTAPSGRPLTYRVVAIDERDDLRGAAAPAGPVTIARP